MEILESVMLACGARKMKYVNRAYMDGIHTEETFWEGTYRCLFGSGLDCGISFDAEIYVKPDTEVWLLATNDCTTHVWERTLRKWRGLLGDHFHMVWHPTTGCGGYTKYLYCTSKEVQVIK